MLRFSPLLVAALALSLGSVANAAAILNTPVTLTTCQPGALSWSGAQGNVYISAVVGTNTAAAPIKVFPVQRGESGIYTWTVDVAEGTVLTFIINDDTGVQNFTGQVTVRAGTTDDCVTGNVSVGAPAATGAPAAAPATSSPASAAPQKPSSSPAASSSTGAGDGRTTTTGTSTFTSIGSGTSTFTGVSSSKPPTTISSAPAATGTGAPANGAWASHGAPSAAAVCAAVLAAFVL